MHKPVKTGQIGQKLDNKNNKNNNNNKVILKIAYALHARDQKYAQKKKNIKDV